MRSLTRPLTPEGWSTLEEHQRRGAFRGHLGGKEMALEKSARSHRGSRDPSPSALWKSTTTSHAV